MDCREQIGGAAEILDGQVEEQCLAGLAVVQLPANFRVVPSAAGDGVVEDRRIGGEAGDRQLVDVALERAAIEQVAGYVVEPQALSELFSLLGASESMAVSFVARRLRPRRD